MTTTVGFSWASFWIGFLIGGAVVGSLLLIEAWIQRRYGGSEEAPDQGAPQELMDAFAGSSTSFRELEEQIDGLEIGVGTDGQFSEGYEFFLEVYATSQGAIDAWGREAERWMVVEENGEMLDGFASYQRGRVSDEALAEEAADSIMVAVHACAVEDIPPELLWRYLILKLGRTKQRIAHAGVWGDDGESEREEVGR